MAKIEIYQDGDVYRARLRTNDGRIDAIAGTRPTCREMAKFVDDWKRQVKASATVHFVSSGDGDSEANDDADAPNYESDNEEENEQEQEEGGAPQEEGTGSGEEEVGEEAGQGVQDDEETGEDGDDDEDSDDDEEGDDISVEDLVANNTKSELIGLCEAAGLETNGNKAELATRICDSRN